MGKRGDSHTRRARAGCRVATAAPGARGAVDTAAGTRSTAWRDRCCARRGTIWTTTTGMNSREETLAARRRGCGSSWTTWTTPPTTTTPPPPPTTTTMHTTRTTRDEVDPLVRTRPRVSASPIARPRVAFAGSARTSPRPKRRPQTEPRRRVGDVEVPGGGRDVAGDRVRVRARARALQDRRERRRRIGRDRSRFSRLRSGVDVVVGGRFQVRRRQRAGVGRDPRAPRRAGPSRVVRVGAGDARAPRVVQGRIGMGGSDWEESSSPSATGSRGESPRSRWSRGTC